ncbi:MAG: peptide deformylase [Gemmataceae bacterium]
MTIRIVPYPHPALRYPAKPVTTIDKELRLLAGRMLELMYEHKGLGLAAPQVAMPVHLLVMNFEGEPENKEAECVAVNPVILSRKGTQEGSEGCLSFPGLYQNVRRAKEVVVQAYDLQGRAFEMTSAELSARIWQHEIDHLHGELFIDKMTPLGKLSSRQALKDFERDYRLAQKKGEFAADVDLLKQLESHGKEVPAGPVL